MLLCKVCISYHVYYYLRQGRFVVVCVSVCLFVCLLFVQLCAKTSEGICMKVSSNIGNGPMNKLKCWWRSGSPCGYMQGLFSGFVAIARYGKWYQPTALCYAAVLGMRRSNYDVITSPALGGGMHCHSASSLFHAVSVLSRVSIKYLGPLPGFYFVFKSYAVNKACNSGTQNFRPHYSIMIS